MSQLKKHDAKVLKAFDDVIFGLKELLNLLPEARTLQGHIEGFEEWKELYEAESDSAEGEQACRSTK